MAVPLHCAGCEPDIYKQTAATVIKLLTKRLGAGKAEVEWEEASYSDAENETHGRSAQDKQKTNGDFAPRGPPRTGKQFKGLLPPPLKVKVSREGGVTGLLDAFAVSIDTTFCAIKFNR
jgi:hypothetical protein